MDDDSSERAETMIEITDLHVEDDRSAPARGVTLRVEEGSVGAAGPRGSGKWAIMKVLATLRQAQGGQARVAGLDGWLSRRRSAGRSGICRIFRKIRRHARRGVDAVLCAGASRGRNAGPVQIEKLLGLAGLAERKDEPIVKLGREQKQRLGVVKTLIHEPSVLLLDDPAMGLEPPARTGWGDDPDDQCADGMHDSAGNEFAERCDGGVRATGGDDAGAQAGGWSDGGRGGEGDFGANDRDQGEDR